MRQILILLFSLIIPIFVWSNEEILQKQNIEKLYFHKPTGKVLSIERVEQGLLVKGWFSDKKRFFGRVKKGYFVDFEGNRIELKNISELVYVKRNSRKGLVFTQEDISINSTGTYVSELKAPLETYNHFNIEGLWYEDESDTYLIVVSTREGIKVRLKVSRTWFSYLFGENDDSFYSEKGHFYVFQNGILRYFHNDGINRMTFNKISESFDGY
ncbi:MAG: hypothetical protein IPK25_10855 [Saprospiraceae bacterium]|nr:hypothetical protein [Saprospiraceae bacterium]